MELPDEVQMESNVTSNEQQIAHLASTPPQTMVNTYVVRSKAAVWYIPQSYKCHSNSLAWLWSLTKQQKTKVQATQMNVLRRIQGVSRMEKIGSEDIGQQLG